jgi:hypothetical protein
VYNQKLIKSIFSYNFYGFKEIKAIENICIVENTEENLQMVSKILKNGEYHRLNELLPSTNVFGENLTVFKFSDQNSEIFYGIFIDAENLEKDPKVYDIQRYISLSH